MDSFEQMYGNLTSMIRKNETYETVSAEYSKIIIVYPDSEDRLLSMLDSAFRNHSGYKTQRRMFELGSTHKLTEIGAPDSSEIYPYSENKELYYSQKEKNKR